MTRTSQFAAFEVRNFRLYFIGQVRSSRHRRQLDAVCDLTIEDSPEFGALESARRESLRSSNAV